MKLKKLLNISSKTALIGVALIVISGIGIAAGGIITRDNSINLNQGLVANWRFDGNANDSSGNGFDGAVNGATAYEDRFGNPDSALDFDGVDDWVSMSNGADLGVSGDMSISFWMYADAKAGIGYLFDNRSPGSWWFIKDYSTCGGASLNICFENRVSIPAASWDAQTWHHIVVTDSVSGANIYLDGELIDSGSGQAASITTNLRAGTRYSNSSYFDGKLDDVFLYQRVLNQSEITALYNAQSEASTVSVGGLQKGLVGWWKLDGDAKDSTPYANHATNNGGATSAQDRFDVTDRAYSFDGTDDYLEAAGNPSYFTGSQDETVSLWVKHNGSTDIFSANSWRRRLFGDKWTLIDIDNTYYSLSAPGIGDNQWHHVAYTKSGLNVKAYVDGAETASDTLVKHLHPANNYFWFGQNCSGSCGGHNYQGLIDNIRLYNRALTGGEIRQIAEQYKPEISISDLSKGLVADYDFNGDAKDKTPYSNHGTVNGATLTADRMGLANYAYDFDGTNDYLEIPEPLFDKNPNVFTVSGWINPSSVHSSRFVTPASAGIDQFIQYTGSDQRISVVVVPAADTSGTSVSSAVNSVLVGSWTHWAVSINDRDLKLYINGVLADSATTGHDIAGWAGHWDIGQRGNSTFWLDGALDDVKIYNRALSAPDIERLYETY